jgi:hypothetical protein
MDVLDVDYKEVQPRAYYKGYDKGRKVYHNGHRRTYLTKVNYSNPYDQSRDKAKHYAYHQGLFEGYDYENENDVKTQFI